MALAGTTSRDVIEYLNTLDYPSLTKVSEKLNEFSILKTQKVRKLIHG